MQALTFLEQSAGEDFRLVLGGGGAAGGSLPVENVISGGS